MERKKTLLAVILSIAITVTAFTGLFLYHPSTPEHGPAFNARIFITGNNTSVPAVASQNFTGINGNISITIFSESPDQIFSHQDQLINLTGYNASSDPYEMVLFNKTGPLSGNMSGHLNMSFWNLSRQWQQYSQGHTGFVSMSMDATLSRVINGTLYAYSYVNNIPYDPYGWNIPALEASNNVTFGQNLYFNVSHPTYTVSMNNETSSAMIHPDVRIGSGNQCTPSITYTMYSVSIFTDTGPLPVMIGAFNGTNNQALTYFMSKLNTSATVDINSITSVSGSATQTETASYGISGAVLGSSNLAEMADPVSMIYFSNVTVQVHRYYYKVMEIYSNCEITIADTPTYTQISVVGTGQSPELTSNPMSYVVNSYLSANGKNTMSANTIDSAFLQVMGETGTNVLAYSGTLGAGNTVMLYTLTGSNTVYSNANAAEQKAMAAVSLLTTAIGTELTIMDVMGAANGADGDLTEPGLVATSIEVGVTVAGDVGYVMSTLSSISYTVTVNEGITVGGFTNARISTGQNMQVTEYRSSSPVELNVDGGSYNVYFPSIVVNATLP